MKTEELNNKDLKQAPYASPSVKVIETAAQRVICQSGDIEGLNVWKEGDDSENWQ